MYITRGMVGVTVIVLAFSSCNSKKDQQAFGGGARRPQGPLQVDGFVVSQRPISEKIEVAGSLLPFEETQLRAEVGGRVVQLNIQEGTAVSKGTILVKLFDQDLQAQLRKLQVQLQIKEKTQERSAELLKINGISQQDYDLSKLEVENLKADMEATKIAISKTEIRAPTTVRLAYATSALVLMCNPDIITTIRRVDELRLEFSVPENMPRKL